MQCAAAASVHAIHTRPTRCARALALGQRTHARRHLQLRGRFLCGTTAMLRFLLFCTMLAGAAAAQHGARNATARPTQGQLATNATALPTTTAKPTTTEQGWPHGERSIKSARQLR